MNCRITIKLDEIIEKQLTGDYFELLCDKPYILKPLTFKTVKLFYFVRFCGRWKWEHYIMNTLYIKQAVRARDIKRARYKSLVDIPNIFSFSHLFLPITR